MRKLVFALALLLLVFLAVGRLLPGEWSVERSIVVAAEPEEVHAPLARLETWPLWSAWTPERDPSARWTFAGAPSGAGAVMRWRGADPPEGLGSGALEIVASDPHGGIAYDLRFEGFDAPAHGRVSLAREGQGTRVVWRDSGDLGGHLVWKYVMLFADMEGAMGRELEASLRGLKERVESAAARAPGAQD